MEEDIMTLIKRSQDYQHDKTGRLASAIRGRLAVISAAAEALEASCDGHDVERLRSIRQTAARMIETTDRIQRATEAKSDKLAEARKKRAKDMGVK